MTAFLHDLLERYEDSVYLPHLFTGLGLLLAFFLVAKLISEKRAPANTFAWLLAIVLVPYVGVPLYLVLGGRKLRRLAGRKSRLNPSLPGAPPCPEAYAAGSVAQTVERAGAGVPVGGNRFELLVTGEEAFAALEREILRARHTIHITTFILGKDEVGRRLVQLLAARAREGVKVRLLLDAFGCLTSSLFFVNPLRRAGGEVGRFMPVLPIGSRTSANLRNHRKLAVFDHTLAIVGGRNITRDYMGPTPFRKRWLDFGALIEGPAAALINEVFIADWCFATRQPAEKIRREIPPRLPEPRGGSSLQVVASGPDVSGDPLYEGIIAMIQEAEESIQIVTPYFIPDDVLLRSLIVKARAGKEVCLIVPARSNHPIADMARRQYTRELRRAGGRVLHYPDGMLHAKAVIVDGKVGLLGSPNFDLRSLFVNFEIGVLAYTPKDVAAMRAWVDGVRARCREPRPEAKRPPLLVSVVEDLSRLFAPLL